MLQKIAQWFYFILLQKCCLGLMDINIYFPKIFGLGQVTLTHTSEDVSFPCLSGKSALYSFEVVLVI